MRKIYEKKDKLWQRFVPDADVALGIRFLLLLNFHNQKRISSEAWNFFASSRENVK